MPFVERPGATIWYEDRGPADGVPVLLIHGGLFDPMNGERFWITPGVVEDLVAGGYRCIVPDRRFSPGRTSADFAIHDWRVESADLAEVVATAGAGACHLIAGSNGCSVALRLALDAPEVVRSLVLCWPAKQDNRDLSAAFDRSAAAIERDGTSAYLDALLDGGLPRPHEERPSWPFGAAFIHDERTRATFAATSASDAARMMRETSKALLHGAPLRGVETADMARRMPPVYVVPAEPEDPYHDRATAEMLAAAIRGARLLGGAPVTPSPLFPDQRSAFVASLLQVFERIAAA